MYCYSCMNEIKDGNYCYKCMKENVPESSSHQLKAGTVLHGKYFVGNPIGEGGFGITYIGMDTVLGKRVAIKEFFLPEVQTVIMMFQIMLNRIPLQKKRFLKKESRIFL